nr:bifunctional adenosylcobinamide kinase/adenosylcobinamide-phosphate guanylyltransferase [Paraflavitalea speifideiaquila]
MEEVFMNGREDKAGIIFVTGGARSGKSRYAQDLALQLSPSPIYVATARKWDEDFQQRVKDTRMTVMSAGLLSKKKNSSANLTSTIK